MADACAAEEDSPPTKICLWCWTKKTHAERMLQRHMTVSWLPRPWSSMDFGGPGGNYDAISEVSMGFSESEQYWAHVAKCRLANCSPQ